MVTPNTKSVCISAAIYTRKSTKAEEGNESNSLAVQRNICESYISSQQHQGWTCIEEHFDDDNVSGGTMDRPSMNRLKALIVDGEVQKIVITRLDRISRSISQFLELMTFLKTNGATLVSVQQNFNTEDAMGELMLQLFISFAQFERSLIRDRVTESMHAARIQGRFLGGRPVLGYNICPEGGALEVDELEAIQVRNIFELYLEKESISATVKELNKRGLRNKKWITRSGKPYGGGTFTISGLHHFLKNRIFIGQVTLKGAVYEGKQNSIIDKPLFDSVQQLLASNSVQKGNKTRNIHAALLKGLLHCTACNIAFSHTYTRKKGRTYRYYTCSNKRKYGAHTCGAPSLPAGEIETLVTNQLMNIGTNADLQETVYLQVVETLQEKRTQQIHQQRAAKRQVERIITELNSSIQLNTPQLQIDQLRLKRVNAERTLGVLNNCVIPPIPERSDITQALQDMHSLWPTFTTPEKCKFVKSLIRRVDYDTTEERVTIHFNDDAFIPSTLAEVES